MPSYKTHSIHGELIFSKMDRKVEITKEDLKIFCIGPDAMISTDYRTFDYQHANSTKSYFETMLKIIKENKLQDNSEIMTFLYGQLDHFILDVVTHPLICYMTEGVQKKHRINPHGLIEHWIDDYIVQKYNKTELLYYRKWISNNKNLKKLIDELYKKVYGVNHESLKYSLGTISMILYDILARRNAVLIAPLVIKMINLGDITYRKELGRVLPYLNLEHEIWYNPETGETYRDSFDDLWKKSIEISFEIINDVNRYLYGDGKLVSPYILNNLSFNTGLPCENGQSLQYVKKY